MTSLSSNDVSLEMTYKLVSNADEKVSPLSTRPWMPEKKSSND